MRKGPEHTSSSRLFRHAQSGANLASNTWNLMAATASVAAPFALVALAVYGAFNLLTFSTVLTVVALFVFAAYLMSGPSTPSKGVTLNMDPTW
ncbi:MAG: hypothetical protein K2X50_07910 [Gammaproteobacteria bacterium]|nr:hypothetical protein [Gammaproteobacteria bacterium]